jgi:hypothetical protein
MIEISPMPIPPIGKISQKNCLKSSVIDQPRAWPGGCHGLEA